MQGMFAVTKMPSVAMDVIFADCVTKGCDSSYTWNLLMTRSLKPWFGNPEMTSDVLRVLDFMNTGKGLDGDKDSVAKVTTASVTEMCAVLENRRAMKTTLSLRRQGKSKGFDKAAFEEALLKIDFGTYDFPWKSGGGASSPAWVKLIAALFPTDADIEAGIVPPNAVDRALQQAEDDSASIRARDQTGDDSASGVLEVSDDDIDADGAGGAGAGGGGAGAGKYLSLGNDF
jgi:hypothetical protein